MKKTFIYALLATALLLTLPACKQEGCTDPDAITYNADADTDNGSCIYPSDLYEGTYIWADTVVTTDNQTGLVTTDIYTSIGSIAKWDKTLISLYDMLQNCNIGEAVVSQNVLTLLSVNTCGINGAFPFDGTNLIIDYTTSDFFESEHHRGVAIKQP